MYSDNFEKEGYTELDFIATMKTAVSDISSIHCKLKCRNFSHWCSYMVCNLFLLLMFRTWLPLVLTREVIYLSWRKKLRN